MNHLILLVEDEKIMRITLRDALMAEGYEVHAYTLGNDAIKAFSESEYDLIISDIRLPDTDGKRVVEFAITTRPEVGVILMTAYGTIKDAVEAMKLGAYDYITKPFSLDEFLIIVRKALEVKALKEENVLLKKELDRCCAYPNLIGESQSMKKILSLINRIGQTDSTVLISGASGTGKELVASAIHYASPRKEKAMIKVNCAALPESLIEAELFGFEKGAFTGALKRKPGRFDIADGSTIFLDEIADIPMST